MRLPLSLLTVLGMVWACTFPAAATCYQGGTMTYGDIDSIGLRDCVTVSRTSRCFAVSLSGYGDGGAYGVYVGAAGAPRLGRFSIASEPGDGQRFLRLIRLLQDARIFEHPPQFRRQAPGHAYVMVDGRHAVIVIERCLVAMAFQIENTEFAHDPHDPPSDPRWAALVNALGNTVDDFSWNRLKAADEHTDFRAIMTFGTPFILAPVAR